MPGPTALRQKNSTGWPALARDSPLRGSRRPMPGRARLWRDRRFRPAAPGPRRPARMCLRVGGVRISAAAQGHRPVPHAKHHDEGWWYRSCQRGDRMHRRPETGTRTTAPRGAVPTPACAAIRA